jgi:hypothetical protein
MPVFNTTQAIKRILSDSANRNAPQPLQLTAKDLDNVYPLTEDTQRWLRNARITVTPDKAHPDGYWFTGMSKANTYWYYTATINLASGADITLTYEPLETRNGPRPKFKARVHWPGAAGDEPLFDR